MSVCLKVKAVAHNKLMGELVWFFGNWDDLTKLFVWLCNASVYGCVMMAAKIVENY